MTTEQLAVLKEVAAKAAEKIRHPDDCDCMAQFNRHFKPIKCLELIEEVERLQARLARLRVSESAKNWGDAMFERNKERP